MPKKQRGNAVVATNRRARHDYTIEDTYEAGIVLTAARSLSSWARWVSTSKERRDSTRSPKNSRRTGFSRCGGKTSRMPPRSENSPGSVTGSSSI